MTKKSWFLTVLGAIGIGTFEATFATLLPQPWRDFRPVIDVAVLYIVLNRPKAALVYVGIAGLILDAFSTSGGLFAFARLLVVVTIMWLLSETVMTNRSVYATIALAIGARSIDRIWVWLADRVGTALFHWTIEQEQFSSFLITLVWDVGSVSLAFMVLAFFTRRFLMTAAKPNRFYEHT